MENSPGESAQCINPHQITILKIRPPLTPVKVPQVILRNFSQKLFSQCMLVLKSALYRIGKLSQFHFSVEIFCETLRTNGSIDNLGMDYLFVNGDNLMTIEICLVKTSCSHLDPFFIFQIITETYETWKCLSFSTFGIKFLTRNEE